MYRDTPTVDDGRGGNVEEESSQSYVGRDTDNKKGNGAGLNTQPHQESGNDGKIKEKISTSLHKQR